ncbi:MAG: Hsp20/alpha crystallin family protein [Thermoplasmata archaeon]
MGFENDFEKMRRRIDKMFRDFFQGRSSNFRSPFVYGFSAKAGRDGVPRIKEFGTMRPTVEGRDPSEREPVYDVIEGEDEIYVTVELPGTTPEKISLRASEHALAVEAHGFRRYWKVLELPEPVEASSLRWTFNNGVLDVTLTKRAKRIRAG